MLVKEVIKRDGSTEPFNAKKIINWQVWASENIQKRVEWSNLVMNVIKKLPEKVSTQYIQEKLIEECNKKKLWPYSLMAGRLYAAKVRKSILGESIPSIKELHNKLFNLGLMKKLDYDEYEYKFMENIIDHSRDFNKSYIEIYQLVNKYGIKDKITDIIYETPQFVYMRMAMALAETDGDKKLESATKFYNYFSKSKLSAPSPNFTNLGTYTNGYSSCCLYTTDDTAESLAIGDHIAYTMTYMSAGIGGIINCRSINNSVRNGAIKHQGKLPYYKSLAAAVNANLQSGRGGACTTYFSCFDPEVFDIINLQNPRTPVHKQNRDIHFAMLFNKLFVEKVYNNENIFTFNIYTAPDLYNSFFSGDSELFKEKYLEYEKVNKDKLNYIPARDIAIKALKQAHEVATLYFLQIDEVNRHTPFKDTIYSSNLCVSPETNILTKEFGNTPIHLLEEKEVHVFNGLIWSKTKVIKTSDKQKLISIYLNNGTVLDCTEYHKWYVLDDKYKLHEKRAYELRKNDKVIGIDNELREDILFVTKIEDNNRYDSTYCVNEPLENKAVFNNILTGNCVEIVQPTKPYKDMTELYSMEKTDEYGEISLCSLAGIAVSNIESDDEYEDVCYYALKMIDKCIFLSEYKFPHLEHTATSRLNASVGIIGLAHELARKKLKYTSLEGLKHIHAIAEKHSYFTIKASLRLGKELGNCPWSHKTKWALGWLPIDTYNKNIDTIYNFELLQDWEKLRSEIIANGGIRNSSLVAMQPTESSSKAIGMPNSIYPIRDFYLMKSDMNNVVDWVAPDNDIYRDYYELAWNISVENQCKIYGIVGKFCDQSISADFYKNRVEEPELKASGLLDELFYMYKYGLKSRYYTNSKTLDPKSLSVIETSTNRGCSSGVCTL